MVDNTFSVFCFQAIFVLLMLGWLFLPVYIASGVSYIRSIMNKSCVIVAD